MKNSANGKLEQIVSILAKNFLIHLHLNTILYRTRGAPPLLTANQNAPQRKHSSHKDVFSDWSSGPPEPVFVAFRIQQGVSWPQRPPKIVGLHHKNNSALCVFRIRAPSSLWPLTFVLNVALLGSSWKEETLKYLGSLEMGWSQLEGAELIRCWCG